MATENDTAQPVPGAPKNPYADEYRRFVEQTKDHVLTILHEDGLYRHLRMHDPRQGSMWSWQVSTIPWFLSTLGDIADGYSFSREEDMLDFFSYAGKNRRYYSDGAPSIDFRYWAEKLRGGRHSMDVKRYSAEDFLQQVREHLDENEALGVEARHDRAVKISLIKLIHQMRGLDEAASQALFDAHASAQAAPNLGTDGLGGGRLGGVHSITWRRANDALRSALDALWSVDSLSEEQIDELIENHGYHRIGDEDFPAVNPLTKVEEIVADARRHSDDEHQAHEWLRDNEEHVGSDTWEWDLRDWDVHFLFTCWAIDLTVEKWREHVAAAEAAKSATPVAEYVRDGVCLLCGDGVLNSGEHIDPDRHTAEVERITKGATTVRSTYIPEKLQAYIDKTVGHDDYASYVLDGQKAEPLAEDGDSWHDVIVTIDGDNGLEATKFTMDPEGAIEHYALTKGGINPPATDASAHSAYEAREVVVGIWPASPELEDNDPEAVVVQIDTGENTGRIRINLNDAPVWDGDPSTDEQPGSLFHYRAEGAPTFR